MPGVADEIEIRALRDTDEIDALLDLAERAFGPVHASREPAWRLLARRLVASGTNRGAFDQGRPVGAAVYHDMRQWWHGRPVPMAGVAGVRIAPEDRGRGIGKRLMIALLDDIAAREYPLSVLYPATLPIYRALGWEVGGSLYTGEAPAWALRTLAPPDFESPEAPRIRRVAGQDADAINEVIGRVHERSRDCGPITWDKASTAAAFDDRHTYAYLCEDGFTWYEWYDSNRGIYVGGVRAASGGALRALWSLIASHGTIAEKYRFLTHPGDPIWQLAVQKEIEIRSTWHWMLRVVDAPAAIAARGFPPGISIDVPLIIADQYRPANAGAWMLTVADGKGELTRRDGKGLTRRDGGALTLRAGGDGLALSAGGDGLALSAGGDGLALSARGLAALYGGASMRSLRIAGLATGGDLAADPALDAAFRCAPYLLDTF